MKIYKISQCVIKRILTYPIIAQDVQQFDEVRDADILEDQREQRRVSLR